MPECPMASEREIGKMRGVVASSHSDHNSIRRIFLELEENPSEGSNGGLRRTRKGTESYFHKKSGILQRGPWWVVSYVASKPVRRLRGVQLAERVDHQPSGSGN